MLINTEEAQPTPEWVLKAKYKSILQVVLATNKWDSKYPLLENIIDGLLEEANKSHKEAMAAEGIRIREEEANEYNKIIDKKDSDLREQVKGMRKDIQTPHLSHEEEDYIHNQALDKVLALLEVNSLEK